MKQFFKTAEAASYLGISMSTLYKYKSNGILKSYKPNGKLLYFLKEDLDEFLNNGKSLTAEDLENDLNQKLAK